jgi:outer membrane protein OmpA-like peptidoglycan-associated protein
MAAKTKVATLKGVLLRPGLSKNRRLYTTENIASAVEGMNKAIASPDGLLLNMATGHKAAFNDDALDTVGRITSVHQLSDGSATFEADVPNTSKGRDIAALTTGPKPFIKSVSIRGRWLGDVTPTVGDDGEEAVTAPGLEIFGVDFTGRPGVGGAEITAAVLAEAQEADPAIIFESAEEWEFVDETGEPVESISEVDDSETDLFDRIHEIRESLDTIIAEKDSSKPYGDVIYADNGFQKDGKKRYPIDTAAHVRAAWSYLNAESNAAKYTSAQVKRMKSKIKSAAKKFGIDIAKESAELAQEFTDLLEAYASSSFDNGAAQISVSGYTDDAGKLAALGQRLALAAQGALYIVDPDADGDVDLVMPDGSTDSSAEADSGDNDDDNMSPDLNSSPACSLCGGVLPDQAMFCPTCGQPVPNAESNDSVDQSIQKESQEAIVPEDIKTETEAPVAEAAPERKMTDADVAALGTMLAGLLKPAAEAVEAPAETPVVEEVAPAAAAEVAPVAETFTAEQMQAKIDEAATAAREEAIAEAVQTFRDAGGARKGLVNTAPTHPGADATETFDAADMSRMSNDEFRNHAWEAWASNLPSNLRSKLAEADASYGSVR